MKSNEIIDSENKLTGMMAYLRWTDIFPESHIEIKDIIIDLKKIAIANSLELLSFIENILSSNEISNIFTQETISKILFENNSQELTNKLKSGKLFVFFHHQQVLFLINLFIAFGDIGQNNSIKLNNEIGNLLLKVNDILEETRNPENLNKEQLIGLLWQKHHFNSVFNQDFGLELSRMYEILFNRKYDFGLNQIFKNVVGLDITKYWAILVAIVFHWEYIFEDKGKNYQILLNPSIWFKNAANISIHDVNIVLDLLSENFGQLKDSIFRKMQSLKYYSVNFESFLEKPILKIDENRYLCLSLSHLIFAATRGIFEILRRRSRGDKKHEKLIFQVTSKIFHEYIKSTLSFVYPDSGIFKRLFSGKSSGIEIADAVIAYNNEMIFVKTKVKIIRKTDKLNSNVNQIESALNGFLLKEGFVQLDKRIINFKNKLIEIGDINPVKIIKYWPMLVSCIDDIPSDGILRNFYLNILQKKGVFVSSDISPLTILSLKEFDYLINHLLNGKSFLDILKDWNSSLDKSGKNICNYLFYDKPLEKRCFPKHLEQSYIDFKIFVGIELGISEGHLQNQV